MFIGVLLKNEQYVEQMVSIFESLHGYVPYTIESDQKRVLTTGIWWQSINCG